MPHNVYVKLTMFGETRLVGARLIIRYRDQINHGAQIDEILYAERVEDEYATSSPQLRDKNIALVRKSDWDHGYPSNTIERNR